MAIELYWGSGSPYAWRVLLALELKGVPYESRLLSLSKQEHKTAEYEKLNPRGRVPTLVDGDVVVRESLAILTYLDRKYPEPALFGHTPVAAAAVMQLVSEFRSYVDEATESFILPLYFGTSGEKAEQVRHGAEILRAELATLEATLATRDTLVDEGITAADLVWFPAIKSIERASGKDAAKAFDLPFVPYERTHPNLARWIRRIESIPGYERTYPPHWRG